MPRTCLVAFALLLLGAGPARAALEAASLRPSRAVEARVPAAVERARSDLGRALGTRGVLTTDPATGGIRSLSRFGGFLTEPAERGPAAVALGYVERHDEAFGLDAGDLGGLRLVARERSPAGIEYLSWAQEVDGVPAIDSRLEASVAPGNRLLAVTGGAAPDLDAIATTPKVTGAVALRAALAGRGGAEGLTAPALVIAHQDGEPRLAWRVSIRESSVAYWDVLVDARTGAVIRRANRVEFARARVFERSPDEDTASLETLPSQWLGESGRLIGPNVHAFADVRDVVVGPGGPVSAPGGDVAPNNGPDWDRELQTFAVSGNPCPASGCTWNSRSPFSWETNRAQDVTQLFWYVNRIHDHLAVAPIGFTTGSFEGDDRVIAQSLDGANTSATDPGFPDCDHANNANFTTLRDGIPGFMQMYLWDPDQPASCSGAGTRAVSGANDPTIVYHEYVHGLTSRLVPDATGEPALDAPQSGAMGEAWSDYYALDLLDPPDGPDARDVFVGRYTLSSPTGVRSQATDCVPEDTGVTACRGTATAGHGGYTYGDFGKISPSGRPQVHADGEIWGQTLWQLRRALGRSLTQGLVTEGLRGAPDNPSFLEVRNAMLQAAQVSSPGSLPAMWSVFAARGMGFYAASTSGDDVAPFENFSTPPGGEVPRSTVSGRVTDVLSGAPVPGALVRIGPFESRTGADGAYVIEGVPQGSYGSAVVSLGGYDEAVLAPPVTVAGGAPLTADARLARDWALASGGATYSTNLSPDYSSFGCGPSSLGDRDGHRAGWVTNPTTATGVPTHATIVLPRAVDVTEIAIDPGARCGSIAEAGLREFELHAGPSEGALAKVAEGAFTPEQATGPVALTLTGALGGTTVLRLVARSQFDAAKAGYIDVGELVVRGTPTPAPPSISAPASELSTVVATAAGATVQGTVGTGGADATTYWFEYGRTTSYGKRTEERTLPAGAASHAVGTTLSKLVTRSAHHVRLVARNEVATTPSADRAFRTTYGLTATPRLRCPRRGSRPRCTLTLPGLQSLRARVELRRNGKRFLRVRSVRVSRRAVARVRVPRSRIAGRRVRLSVKVTFRAPGAKRSTVESRAVSLR